MIRVMESEQYSDDIEQQIQDVYEQEKEYWKKDEWVYNRLFVGEDRKNSLVYVTFTPILSGTTIRIDNLCYVKGNFLCSKNIEQHILIKNGKAVYEGRYWITHHDTVCRIKKTSLKTPDKQAIFTPRGEEDNKLKFVKDEREMFVPYFGEVIEPKKRGSEV